MKKYLAKLVKKAGLPPGSTVHIGSSSKEPIQIKQIIYTHKKSEELTIIKTEDIQTKAKGAVNWLDIRGLHKPVILNKIGKLFNLHPLTLEDIANTSQLPKIEEKDNTFFLIIKAISMEHNSLELEHICLYIDHQLVISFQERPSDTFNIVRQRILEQNGKIREKKSDYLLYALFDYVIDTYFETLRHIDQQIEALTLEVDENPGQNTLKNIQALKKELLQLKRHFWYTREIVHTLKQSDSKLIEPATEKYLNDLSDHIAHISDISESFREELIDLSERHLASINLRANDITKTLTIIASIFMPLTFIAGIYGMNFKVMPELEFSLGYPIVLCSMAAIAIVLLVFFKIRKWV